MDETIEITMRRTGPRGSMCTKTCSRLKCEYSQEDQLASMSSSLQSPIQHLGCEKHLQLQRIFEEWTAEKDDKIQEDDDYGF